MGRPIKPRYISKYNQGDDPGANIASVTISASGSGYYAANAAVTFSLPQAPGGVRATGTVQLSANGNGYVTGVTITNAGTGYTSATVTFGGANTSTASGTVTVNSEVSPSIRCYAYVPTGAGGVSAKVGQIVKQENGHGYRVTTADGTGFCLLAVKANASLTASTTLGQMNIQAFDSAGGTYWVRKMWDRTVTVDPVTGTQFAANTHVAWTFGTATVNTGTSTKPSVNATVTIDHS